MVAKIEQSEDSTADIIEEARRDWTIGINPAINWERNNIKAKIDLINPDITIITSTIKPCPLDMEEFNTQIKELLYLEVIRESRSKHRSAAFMVRNHSEIKREKARMVINYKILNDNIRDDTYLIPNKDAIQRIGEAKNI